MSAFIAQQVMKQANVSLAAGQAKYRAYFVSTALYLAYQSDVRTILETTFTTQYPEGYGACIISA